MRSTREDEHNFALTKLDRFVSICFYVTFAVIVLLLSVIAHSYVNARVAQPLTGKKFKCAIPTVEQITLTKPRVTSEIILLRNAILLNESGQFNEHASDVLLENGIISQVTKASSIIHPTARIIDVQSRLVTPGLIDTHAHLGVHSYPQLSLNNDVNEKAGVLMPMVRVIDGFNPRDLAIKQAMTAGVTTAQILPGSSNLMGGETMLIKTIVESNETNIDDLLVRDRGVTVRGYKFALGENPKRTYKTISRLGHGAYLRQVFQDARTLLSLQDNWYKKCSVNGETNTPMPYNGNLEPLVSLLRYNKDRVNYKIIVNVHVYRVVDIELLTRVSKEMGFKINVLHHASQVHRVIDLVKQNNFTVALFSDQWGSKWEMYDASVYTARDLHRAGVPVVIKTDHPVTPSKDLIYQVGKTVYYGLPQHVALQSVTNVAAKSIGQEHRLGVIREGYDADIVVWDRNPLQIGAIADKVIINGKLVSDKNLEMKNNLRKLPEKQSEMQITNGKAKKGYILTDVTIYTMHNGTIHGGSIVVTKGQIACIGTHCTYPADHVHITLSNCKQGECIVVPGFIESNSNLGLVEVAHEQQTNDGASSSILHQGGTISLGNKAIHAVDGLQTWNAKTLRASWRSGITTSVSSLPSNFLFNGFSALWHPMDMSSHPGIDPRTLVISEEVALHLKIGNDVKHGGSNSVNSIAGQIYELRTLLSHAGTNCSSNYPASTCRATERVIRKEANVVLHANKAEDINQVLKLQKVYHFKLIIMGGAEAHVIVDKLVAQGVSVVLTPNMLQPTQSWSTMATLPDYGLQILLEKGVNVGIAYGNVHKARGLRWITGRLMEMLQLPFELALSLITTRIVEIFDLTTSTKLNGARTKNANKGIGRIQVGTRANFVLFDGNPLTFEGAPRLVALGKLYDIDLEQD